MQLDVINITLLMTSTRFFMTDALQLEEKFLSTYFATLESGRNLVQVQFHIHLRDSNCWGQYNLWSFVSSLVMAPRATMWWNSQSFFLLLRWHMQTSLMFCQVQSTILAQFSFCWHWVPFLFCMSFVLVIPFPSLQIVTWRNGSIHKHLVQPTLPMKSVYCPCASNNSSPSHKFFSELLCWVGKGKCFTSNVINRRGAKGRQNKIIVEHQFPWLLFVFEEDFNWKEKASITSLGNCIGRILQN